MTDKKGTLAKSSKGRFIFGAAIGIAISVALFSSIENAIAKFFLMAGFGTLMGLAQVYAARETAGARKFTKYAIVAGVVTMGLGIVIFLMID
jgi:hypothetical protein